jgi:hypothetical protein
MQIQLIQPHEKQKDIVNACLDRSIFFIVAIIGRQFGKTVISENMALYWALNNNNNIIYWISPTDSQVQKVYKDILESIIDGSLIRTKKASKGDTEIVFNNNSKILFRSAGSEDSLRGQSVDYMILDEAAFIKRDTVETILLPMLNVRGKKCLFISTPKGKNYLYDYFKKGKIDKNWFSIRYSTFDSPYVNTDLIQMFRDTLPPKLFSQEIEAEFVDSSSVFNNLNDIMILNRLDLPESANYYGGIDIGLINDASVLSIVDDNGDLVNYYKWEKLETPELIEEIIKISNKWKLKKILIENNNQGLPIYQDLKRKINNIQDFNTNSKTKPELINNLIHLFNVKGMKLIKDDYLKLELESFIFKQNDNGNVKFMADYGFHDDCVMSLAIARHCFDKYKNSSARTFFIG